MRTFFKTPVFFTVAFLAVAALIIGLFASVSTASAAPAAKDPGPTIKVVNPVAGASTTVTVTVKTGTIKRVSLRIDNRPVKQHWRIDGRKATARITWPKAGSHLMTVGVLLRSGRTTSAGMTFTVAPKPAATPKPGASPKPGEPGNPNPSASPNPGGSGNPGGNPGGNPTPGPSSSPSEKTCPSGTTDLGNGMCRSTQAATKGATTSYNATAAGGQCTHNTYVTHPATCQTAACGTHDGACISPRYAYSCSTGYVLNDATCYCTMSQYCQMGSNKPATPYVDGCLVYEQVNNTCASMQCPGSWEETPCDAWAPVTYSCPSGGTLSGTECNVEGTYSCPSGWTLSGTSCHKDTPKG